VAPQYVYQDFACPGPTIFGLGMCSKSIVDILNDANTAALNFLSGIPILGLG
jgi:hypothetical protein